MIISITGHRKLGSHNIPNPVYNYVAKELENKFLELKPDKVITGMALGTDTLAAEICLKLNIPYLAAIPFVGQENLWKPQQKQTYNDLLFEANETFVVCSGGYATYKLQKRNQWMVNNADLILAVFDGSSGGTKNCIDYAKLLNKQIIIINPNEGVDATDI